MEKELKFLQAYFELITVKDFCKKYNLAYETIRRNLTGEHPLSQKTFNKIAEAMRQFEQDQLLLKRKFYNTEE